MFVEELNFLKVTEMAAIEVADYKGALDKYTADEKATNMMRELLNQMPIKATVVIGEGEMDEAPMLYIGEELGKGGLSLDIAVDPLDGTTLAAKNQNNAITVIALTERGGFLNAPDMYMKKLVVGSVAKGKLDIKKSLTENLKIYQKCALKDPQDIKVVMLDRDRHKSYMKEVIDFGAKLKLVSDGDVLPGILSGIEGYDIDILFGIGAAPEGVITAAAMKCLGGDFQGILMPENKEQEQRCQNMGIKDPKNQVFTLNDLVKTNHIVVALTAVTDGYIGKGVCKKGDYMVTNSLKIASNAPVVQYVQSHYRIKGSL